MEKVARVLIIDLDGSKGLAQDLITILKSSINPEIYCVLFNTDVYSFENSRVEFPRAVSHDVSELIFVIFDESYISNAEVIVRVLRTEFPDPPIFFVVEDCTPNRILELLKLGINDFITSPLKAVGILPRVWQFLRHETEREEVIHNLKNKLGMKQIIGTSPSFLKEVEKIPLIANSDASVLISGESGTGKELFARAIHYLSHRARKPFVPVSCGAIPTDLVENELFGHDQGAFTGATTFRNGLIKEADGGTLVLDEIDCLPIQAQVKVLRFLQEKEFRPLGSTKMQRADVRVLAATNIDIEQAMNAGKFRQDLYYRINIIPVNLPALRERKEDIPLLAEHFLSKYFYIYNKRRIKISQEALSKLELYDWPGNVRELENIIERAIVLSDKDIIRSEDILQGIVPSSIDISFQAVKARYVADFEKTYITGLLRSSQGNVSKAARAAKKNRRAFWQLMRKHRISAYQFR